MRVSKPPGKFVDYVMLSNVGEPSCYNEAISVHDHVEWKQAIRNELDSIHKNGTWDFVPFPKRRKALDINGCISTNIHLIMLFQSIKHTLWQKVLSKNKEWTLMKFSLHSMMLAKNDFNLFSMDVKLFFCVEISIKRSMWSNQRVLKFMAKCL